MIRWLGRPTELLTPGRSRQRRLDGCVVGLVGVADTKPEVVGTGQRLIIEEGGQVYGYGTVGLGRFKVGCIGSLLDYLDKSALVPHPLSLEQLNVPGNRTKFLQMTMRIH